jgi:hypothetical protein
MEHAKRGAKPIVGYLIVAYPSGAPDGWVKTLLVTISLARIKLVRDKQSSLFGYGVRGEETV